MICERERIQCAFQQIGPAIRAEFVMHVIYGFTSHEIANALEKPEGTVSSHIARARVQFRQAYEQ